MDLLNLLFGIIGTASAIFGLWSYFKMKRSEDIKNRGVFEIRRMANKIKLEGSGTLFEGYADGIISSCNTLLDDQPVNFHNGQRIKYKTYEYPMQTKIGEPFDDPFAVHGKAIKAIGKRTTGIKYNHLVFGPYTSLPNTGDYEAVYRIRLLSLPDNVAHDKEILKIDVYNHYSQRITLAQKKLCKKDFRDLNDYNEFKILFHYSDVNQSLEYRIEIIYNDVEISSDLICLKRIL